MKINTKFYLINILALVICLNTSKASEVVFEKHTAGEMIYRDIREKILSKDAGEISFSVRETGKFIYNHPLLDNNKKNEWHKYLTDPNILAKYEIINLHISDESWEDASGKHINNISNLIALFKPEIIGVKKYCCVLHIDKKSKPFSKENFFLTIFLISEARLIFAYNE